MTVLAHAESLLDLRLRLPLSVRSRTLVVGEHLICQDSRVRIQQRTGRAGYLVPASSVVLEMLGHRMQYRQRVVPSCGISDCVHPGHLLAGQRVPAGAPAAERSPFTAAACPTTTGRVVVRRRVARPVGIR